jgi:protein-tyrosine phosphatase
MDDQNIDPVSEQIMASKAGAILSVLGHGRRGVVQVRDFFDGLRHGSRRSKAMRRLSEYQPASVLFVCLGNVCRSPFAAAAMARGATRDLRVFSAGFIGAGRAPPEPALRAAAARGVDTSAHVSRIVTAELIQSADVTFVFDRYHVPKLRQTPGVRVDRVFWLGDLDPTWTGKRAIADPWGREDVFFDQTFERITRCVDGALSILNGEDPKATASTP